MIAVIIILKANQGVVHKPLSFNLNHMFSSSTTWDRNTTHPKFNPTGVRTHDLQIMTVHFQVSNYWSSSFTHEALGTVVCVFELIIF